MGMVNACTNKPAKGTFYSSNGGTSATGCKTTKWVSTPTLLGRFDIPVEYKGSASKTTWTKVNARTGIGFTFGDYPGATKIRGCMTFTDSSSGKGKVYARLREAGGKNKVYFSDNYGETWSGSGLIHHECGAWQDIKKVVCGYSWGNDCQIDVKHTQGVSLQIWGFDFEIATTSFPSKIAAGVFDLPITYSKAGTKQYSRWRKQAGRTRCTLATTTGRRGRVLDLCTTSVAHGTISVRSSADTVGATIVRSTSSTRRECL